MSRVPSFSCGVAFFICCLTVFPGVCESARILGFFPTPSKSHLIIHTAIADALVERGHNVTVFTTVPNFKKNPKYNLFTIDDVPMFDEKFIKILINKSQPVYYSFGGLIKTVAAHSNITMAHPKTQKFLRDHKDSFDLIILGYFFNDFQLGLAAHFNCPVIVSFMIQPVFTINRLVGNPAEAAYVPTLYSQLKQPMCFMERVKNFILHLFESWVLMPMIDSQANSLYRKYFPTDSYPPLEEMYRNVSLVLTNHHFSLSPIRPNVPNLIEIGGIQIKEKPDPLPTDLADVLDNSKEGVIYFSLGTNVQSSVLTEDKIKHMFNALASLPYKVFWKWNDDDAKPGIAKNIIYRNWLPQDDLLAHPNVKLFITHGGQGSVVESQYHGVPMVGIPLFGDQYSNMANVENSGFGISLPYRTLNEKLLRDAVVKVIENKQYANAVKEFARLYRDRPMTARETAIYWIEYVLRHHGAKHLQSPAVHMNFLQLTSLDVISFLVLIVGSIFVVFIVVCKVMCCRRKKNCIRSNEKKSTESKKNKNE